MPLAIRCFAAVRSIGDDIGHPGNDAVHLLEVQLAAGLVELVDLARHPEQFVLGPAQSAEPAAVAILLVRGHLGRDVGLERRAGAGLALFEFLLHLGIEAIEDLLHVDLGGGEDPLDLGGDLGAFGLVLRLGLALVRDQLGQRSTLGALHAGDAGGRLRGSLDLALRQDLVLLRPELAGRRIGVRSRGLLVSKALLELRLVRLRELLVADFRVRHLLIGLLFTGGEIQLLGRRRFGDSRPRPESAPAARPAPAPSGSPASGRPSTGPAAHRWRSRCLWPVRPFPV